MVASVVIGLAAVPRALRRGKGLSRGAGVSYSVGMAAPLEANYSALKAAAAVSLRGDATTEALVTCIRQSLELLAALPRIDLQSKVPGKEYFAFGSANPARVSRGINVALFVDDIDEVVEVLRTVITRDIPATPLELHRALYTAAISYPAGVDVTKTGDKKTPGTYFENFVGHLVARAFDADATKTITAPTLDLEISLPTDFIFDLGEGKSRIHLPVKASTRERVVQVWAHQRVLDGMHGVNRFRGVLVVLAETNKIGTTAITEVCLPNQWTAYQMYIAQMHRVYYLDLPEPYRGLRATYPFLEVKPFADFFYECEEIANPTLAVTDLVEPATPPASLVGLPEDYEV